MQSRLRQIINSHQSILKLTAIWLFLRLFSFGLAAFSTTLRPEMPLEREVALFPPSVPVSRWLERVFLSPWERWDVFSYLFIAIDGYAQHLHTLAFHPLYPALGAGLNLLVGQMTLSLLIISSLAGLAYILSLYYLARFDFSASAAFTTALLAMVIPPAYILFAPYTESLFLMLAVITLICARRGAWWRAGLIGGLAALTRQQGLILLLPLAWEFWHYTGQNFRLVLKNWRQALALGLIPLSYVGWFIYRATIFRDFEIDFHSFNGIIYSFILSPKAMAVLPNQEFMAPWQAFWLAGNQVFTNYNPPAITNFVLGLLFLVGLGLAWRNMRASYRLYALAIALISFAYHTGLEMPYISLPRHLLLAFPVLIGLGPLFNHHWRRLLVVGFGFIGFSFLLILYTLKGIIP